MSGFAPLGTIGRIETLGHGALCPATSNITLGHRVVDREASPLSCPSLFSSSSSTIQLACRSLLEFFVLPHMDSVAPSEHLCYVRCTYCNTVLAVGVPCKRMMDTLTVKCGHCNHLSFLSTRPMVTLNPNDHPMNHLQQQAPCTDFLRGQPSASSPSSSSEPTIQNPPIFVVKPPEKKHRTPSAYNRFMKEEIKRIKAAQPTIPHREAFSMAAKNWAKCDPRNSIVSTSDSNKTASSVTETVKGINNCLRMESSTVFKHMEHNG